MESESQDLLEQERSLLDLEVTKIRELSNAIGDAIVEAAETKLPTLFEDRMKADIEEQTKRVLRDPGPVDQQVALGLLYGTLSKLTDGLRTSVAFQRDEVEQLRAELEREQGFAREHAEVHSALLKTQASQPLGSDQREQLTERLQRYRTSRAELMAAMARFVNEHYPRVAPDDGIAAHLGRAQQQQPTEFLSMLQLLQRLMNRAVTAPADPYLDFAPERGGPAVHEPHLRVLVQAGVASRHPQDRFRVRLEDFSR